MMQTASFKSEFTVKGAYQYDQSSPLRWVISHVLRYKFLFLITVLLYIANYFVYTLAQVMVGTAVGAGFKPLGAEAVPSAIPLYQTLGGAAPYRPGTRLAPSGLRVQAGRRLLYRLGVLAVSSTA